MCAEREYADIVWHADLAAVVDRFIGQVEKIKVGPAPEQDGGRGPGSD